MAHLNRRSIMLGLAAAPAVLPTPSVAQEGREIAPGVRRIDYGKYHSMIPAYKTVSMRDLVYQPGASTTNPTMGNDMVCHVLEGELTVATGGAGEVVFKKGDVWSCAKGGPENGKNNGSTVAIMRVIDLLPA
jgi:quercetin dioxygenase-like cupin family protein